MHRLQLDVQPEEFVLRLMHGDCFRLPLCIQLGELLLERGAILLQSDLALCQLRGRLCQCLLGGLARRLLLRHPLFQRVNLFSDTPVLLVGLLQASTHCRRLGFQPGEFILRRLQRLLGCFAGRLFLLD